MKSGTLNEERVREAINRLISESRWDLLAAGIMGTDGEAYSRILEDKLKKLFDDEASQVRAGIKTAQMRTAHQVYVDSRFTLTP